MAGFIYYQPGDKPPTRDSLRAAGFVLADLAAVPGRQCLKGPDGGYGYLFTLNPPVNVDGRQPDTLYKPETQVWSEHPDGGLWIGWEKGSLPTRFDLVRKADLAGRAVTMADGEDWIVPVLRTLVGATTLPTTLGLGPNGTVIQHTILPEFAELWGMVQALWDAVIIDDKQLDEQQSFRLAYDALGMNYRIGGWEIGVLGLFTTDTLAATFAAIVGVPESTDDAQ